VLGLVVLAVFGAVVLLTLIVMDVLRRALVTYERYYLQERTRKLDEMFIFIDSRQLLILAVSVALLLLILGTLVFNWFVGILLCTAGFLSPQILVRRLRNKRLRQFERQLVDALLQMSSALRAGLTFPQASENVAQEFKAPLGDEFKLLVREIKLGVSLDDALDNLAKRVDSDSLRLTVTSTNISRKLGGNLAEIYDTISKTVRDRFEVQGRIDALTAMGRMQGWVVGAMPVVVGLALNFIRPDLMAPMLASNFGKGLVLCVIGMELLGIWLMRRVVDIDF
jgi:tight adherence protein B